MPQGPASSGQITASSCAPDGLLGHHSTNCLSVWDCLGTFQPFLPNFPPKTASLRSAEFLLLAHYIIVMGFLNCQLQNIAKPGDSKGQRLSR